MADAFARAMRRRSEQEQRRTQRKQHRALYGHTTMRWWYHGSAGQLADSIQANGIRVGGDGRAYLTASPAVALAYATWSTGMIAAMPTPYGPPTTEVGRAVAAAGGHVAVVFGVRLPADKQLEPEDAFPPPLPWQDAIVDGECFYAEEPIPALAVGRWELFRPPELADPVKLAALQRDGELISRAFARAGYGQASGPFASAVPDPAALIEAVRAASPNARSQYHGDDHWRHVAAVGERILRDGCDGDAAVVFAFSVMHDALRLVEGRDPEHGERAATFAREQADAGLLRLDGKRLDVLCDALTRHDRGDVSDDPTTGACFDADRLTLPRLGITPDPALLSTQAGRALAADAARLAKTRSDWRYLIFRYHLAAQPIAREDPWLGIGDAA